MGSVIQGVASIGSGMSVQTLDSEIITLPLPRRDGCWWPSGNSPRKDLFFRSQVKWEQSAEAVEINVANVLSPFVHFYLVIDTDLKGTLE